jgi:hypothetical protein
MSEDVGSDANVSTEANADAEVIVQPQVNTTAASDNIPPEVNQHASTKSNDAGTVLAYN